MNKTRTRPQIRPAQALTAADIHALHHASQIEVRFTAKTGTAAIHLATNSLSPYRQYFPDTEHEPGLRVRTIHTDVEIFGCEGSLDKPRPWGISNAITTVCEAHLSPGGGLLTTFTSLLEEGDTLTQVWFADDLGPGPLAQANLTRDELALHIKRPGRKALIFHLASYSTRLDDPERLVRKGRAAKASELTDPRRS